MGGSVAVILKHNNQITKMSRRTGVYQSLLFDKRLYGDMAEQTKAVKSFVKTFKDMRQDYLSGPPYQHDMSYMYGPHNTCSPEGYGIVYIDLDKKEVHSMQGYDNPGTRNFYILKQELNEKTFKSSIEYLIETDNLIIDSGVDKKKYNLVDFFGTQDPSMIFKLIDDGYTNYQKMIKKDEDEPAQTSNPEKSPPIFEATDPFFYDIELKNWKLVRYAEQDITALASLYQVMSESIDFTPQDKALWIEWASNYFEDYSDKKIEQMEKQNISQAKIEAYIDFKVKTILDKFSTEIDSYKTNNPAEIIEIGLPRKAKDNHKKAKP